ncbi:Release factor glutamine methyltransferase [BD1-7 clade bacterium]|uniref:Release factor glutamine methyltransferase n=1 Tax=BD1-7 clade bacterium TaxID=2029982 RepID=A0A5S9MRL9_9GAMM|nr:Release factor glutamine methyltransferase [BD1-7 clade bacterium]
MALPLIREWQAHASEQLVRAGVDDSPELDASLLLQHVLDCNASYLMAWSDKSLTDAQIHSLAPLLQRRCQGEPVAYLLGYQGFWTLDLKVSSATLIPRADTEHLVEQVLACYSPNDALRVLDLGTGTGAIALALKSECPRWDVWMADLSADALAIACMNATELRVPVRAFQGSWLDAIAPQSLDVIVSNPPYIRDDDPHLRSLQYEPHSALVAEGRGLADIRQLVAGAQRCLHAGGRLFIEHGYDQADDVNEIFVSAGFSDVRCDKDYGNNDRFTWGYWPGEC